MVWEGKTWYQGLDELLRDLDQGIAQWTADNSSTLQEQADG